jgi:hypothetical protein
MKICKEINLSPCGGRRAAAGEGGAKILSNTPFKQFHSFMRFNGVDLMSIAKLCKIPV